MKIVCDACQAKYSISDDKVQGKVFKIRCKKCSNIIVVRGGAGAAEPAAAPAEKDTRVYDYGYDGGGGEAPAGDDAVWHLVINQDQVGPMTVIEVQQRFAAGEVDGETFTWREGFADWLPLSQVDVFAALAAGGAGGAGAASAPAHSGGAAAIGAMFGGGDDGGTSRSDPGDLFASAGGASGRHDEDDAGGDLFGSKPSSAAAAQAAANTKLRGERNENSVLFSLNNLAQLASDKPAMSVPSNGGGGGGGGGAGHATGAAGGEGSGLIDIRSMASAYMGGPGASVGKPAAASSIGSIDDLPVFGGGGFSEPAVIVPTARPAANNKIMFVMIGAIAVVAVLAIVLVVVLMKGGSKDTKPAAVADNGSAAKPDVVADKTDKTDPKPDPAAADPKAGSAAVAAADPKAGTATGNTTTTTAAADPKPTPPPTDTTTHAATPPPTHTPTTHTTTTTHAAATTPTKTSTTTTVATTKTDPKPDSGGGGGCDEVSCVLNNYEGACCSKFRKGGNKTAPAKPAGGGGGDLPDALDRGMISGGIANVKARVSSCGDKSPAKGKVKVHVKVGGDGRVANVSVEASPDPALGACVAAAVSKASFGKTQNGGSFSYPFVF